MRADVMLGHWISGLLFACSLSGVRGTRKPRNSEIRCACPTKISSNRILYYGERPRQGVPVGENNQMEVSTGKHSRTYSLHADASPFNLPNHHSSFFNFLDVFPFSPVSSTPMKIGIDARLVDLYMFDAYLQSQCRIFVSFPLILCLSVGSIDYQK